MPAFTSFSVNDREATPVAHTFTPHSKPNGVSRFVESDGVPIGDKIITVSSRQVGSKYKIRLVLTDPVVVTETINGVNVPKVDRTAYAAVDFTFDQRSTLQERKNTVGMFANALAATVTPIDGVVTGLEGHYT